MKVSRTEHAREASFDLTPMIDVVLLLIIFFTLTAQFSKSQRLAMDLPREKGVRVDATPPLAIVIEVDRTGAMSIGGTKHDDASLAQLVSREVANSPGGPGAIDVIVRADRLAKAGSLSRLAATLRSAGVQRWKLATAPEG